MKRILLLVTVTFWIGVLAVSPKAMAQAPDQPAPVAAAVDPNAIEPGAIEALARMSAYLGGLKSFEVVSDTVIDEVTSDGQKLQFAGKTTYKVRKPNAFYIEAATDRKVRKMYYDGKKFTVFAPRMGYYAQADAPPTTRELLDQVYDRYGITVPLEDLFQWSTQDARKPNFASAYHVGFAKVDGVDCDQYAYREDDIDWQIWIERGSNPAPRKIVITSREEEGQPQFSATLRWTANPTLSDDTFKFSPPKDSKTIVFGGAVS